MRPFSAPALSSPESKSGCLAAKRAAISFDVCFHPGRALHLRGRQRGDTNGLKDLRSPEDGVLFQLSCSSWQVGRLRRALPPKQDIVSNSDDEPSQLPCHPSPRPHITSRAIESMESTEKIPSGIWQVSIPLCLLLFLVNMNMISKHSQKDNIPRH